MTVLARQELHQFQPARLMRCCISNIEVWEMCRLCTQGPPRGPVTKVSKLVSWVRIVPQRAVGWLWCVCTMLMNRAGWLQHGEQCPLSARCRGIAQRWPSLRQAPATTGRTRCLHPIYSRSSRQDSTVSRPKDKLKGLGAWLQRPKPPQPVPVNTRTPPAQKPFESQDTEDGPKPPNLGYIWGLAILSLCYLHHSTTGYTDASLAAAPVQCMTRRRLRKCCVAASPCQPCCH